MKTLFAPLLALLLLSPVAHSQLTITDTTFIAFRDPALTVDVDLDTRTNKIILVAGKNTNLALGKGIVVKYANLDPAKISPSAYDPKVLLDGRLASNSFFEFLSGQEGSYLRIDLQAKRVVNQVKTRPYPANNFNFRLRGYSIYLGLDTLSFTKVKQVADNGLANTDDVFEADTCRYVLIVVDKMDPNLANPFSTILGEIEVYGTGYLAAGVFTSSIRDAGTVVNWGRVSWDGLTPEGTSITMQLRTGSNPIVDNTWSLWSQEGLTPGSIVDVNEPRRYVQYRVNLYTLSTETPQVNSASVSYDTLLVMRSATAQLSSPVLPILKQAIIDYQVAIQSDSRSTGIDTLRILTSIPVEITGVRFNNVDYSYTRRFTPGRIDIALQPTINVSGTIAVGIRITPFLLQTAFPSFIVSNANPLNPQRVDAAVGADSLLSWTLVTSGIPEETIVSAKAVPNPFTPNGDGRNDVTSFSFFVSNLLTPRPVRLTIYDITGRRVRSLVNEEQTAHAYVEQSAIQWNGRDDNGRLLPPGLYIYQIVVDVDGVSSAVVTKTITIAY